MRKFQVLFIYPDLSTDIINFSPAIQLLSAVLKQEGCDVNAIHINNEFGTAYDKETILELANGYNLFALTSTSFNYRYANEIAGWLKEKYPHVLRILGGSHATIQPEDFEASNFDIFCVGEGEDPMTELTHAIQWGLDWTKIPNLITRFGRNPVRGFTKDLDRLPCWDFSVLDTKKILEARNGWLSISFSRGCPYECTFCINHLYKKIEMGPGDKMSDYLRRRSPENAILELELLVAQYPIRFFNIDDDLLTMNKPWMVKFTQLYKERIYEPFGIKYVINARADTLDENTVECLVESGCREARIGFETGNEELRNQLLQKHASNEGLERAFSMLRKYGVMGVAFAMIGLPGESAETFLDTVDMTIKLRPGLIRMTFLFPYKHTRIYDICVEKGLFKTDEIGDNRDYSSPLRFDNISDQQLFCYRFLFPWYVNAIWFEDLSYANALMEFTQLELFELEASVPAIIERDKELSSNCKTSHYRYYSNNPYYFELYEN
jgi:radical SAM superfamily enzyme YgiQ (UPF0313 family)